MLWWTVLAAGLISHAAATCESWCTKWTCGNTNSCGGCNAAVCEGPNPHAMCSDTTQPHCEAPRCDSWCSSSPASYCGRVECQCSFCSSSGLPNAASVQSLGQGGVQQPVADGTCDTSYLLRIKSELTQMIDDQSAKNRALQLALGASVPPLPPPVAASPSAPPAPTPPPPPPCSALHAQCGGFNHNGPTTCCSGMRCHYYNEYYSGCLANTQAV